MRWRSPVAGLLAGGELLRYTGEGGVRRSPPFSVRPFRSVCSALPPPTLHSSPLSFLLPPPSYPGSLGGSLTAVGVHDRRYRQMVKQAETHADVPYTWTRSGTVDVMLVPILADNYSYIFVDRTTGKAACVDPAEPSKVLAAAKHAGVHLELLLCTHHHLDHAGGNREMMDQVPQLEVVCSYHEPAEVFTKRAKHGDKLQFGSVTIEVLHTPCHTHGHVMYYITGKDDTKPPVLFSGDTIFVGGCGRFLEGTASEMISAMRNVVGVLPPETQLFCGHEYTHANLEFAVTVEPSNQILQDKLQRVRELRRQNLPTIPSTIGEELDTNPFLRFNCTSLKSFIPGGHHMTESEVMGTLRAWKNVFQLKEPLPP